MRTIVMELRLLKTGAERHSFARMLSAVRMKRGAGFSETSRSVMGEVHLAFGNLYGLFNEGEQSPEMLGGFALHNLAMFGQSYSRPDLTHLPPESVFECGELWAMAAGAGSVLRYAGVLLAGVLRAKAALVYPIVKPWNLSGSYRYFERIDEPIEWPYARTLDGRSIFVQAMVLQGDALTIAVSAASHNGFETFDGGGCLRFNAPQPISLRRFIAGSVGGDDVRCAVGIE
jgi:hypothetical protein